MARVSNRINEWEGSDIEYLNEKYGGKPAHVYCTNGGRLDGIVHFAPDGWLEIENRSQGRTARVNPDFTVSIAFQDDLS